MNNRPVLIDAFEQVYQRVTSDSTGEQGHAMALFVFALVEGFAFDLSQIEQLPEPDQVACLDLFDYCLNSGLTEDERSAASAAFRPFVEIHSPGWRH